MSTDNVAREIEDALSDLAAQRKALGGDRASWVPCHIVVVEDIEAHPEGVNAAFLAVPRVGEYVSGFGTVVEVSPGPMLADGSTLPYPYVTLFVQRDASNAHRT